MFSHYSGSTVGLACYSTFGDDIAQSFLNQQQMHGSLFDIGQSSQQHDVNFSHYGNYFTPFHFSIFTI